MPTGIYKRTIKAKKNIGLAAMGRIPWNKGNSIYCGGKRFEKGHIPWSKGKKRPDITGFNNPNWKGGKNKKHNGYVEIYLPNHPNASRGYIYEHRFIVEQQIGRYLRKKEVVHHLGKRNDNRQEMLMAFISTSAHERFEHGLEVKQKEIIFDGRRLIGKALEVINGRR